MIGVQIYRNLLFRNCKNYKNRKHDYSINNISHSRINRNLQHLKKEKEYNIQLKLLKASEKLETKGQFANRACS